jgi:predicted alpha/beta superfamily hydrolase
MIETLVEYAREGNFDEFRKLLYKDPSLLEQTLPTGESPLIAALYNGKNEIVDYLLEKGIAVTIHEAAALGDEETLAFLLDHEPRLLDEYSYDGWTPLHLTAFFGALEATQLLLARGAQTDAIAQNHLRNTPLHVAVAGKRSAVVHHLLQRGANPNVQQKGGLTPLHMAVTHYDLNMVRMLLDFGADATVTDERGANVLEVAEQHEFVEIIEIIRRYAAGEGTTQPRVHILPNVYLPALNAFRTLRVYLPPTYDVHKATTYPVIYMHDGQNLFDRTTSSYGMIWDVAQTIDGFVERGEHPGWIVVGIDNNSNGIGRYMEYSPWESEVVKSLLPHVVEQERVGGEGFTYITDIVETVKPYIDKHYRTQSEKHSTVIAGSSMGGYISLAAGFAHPDVFGYVVACSTAVFFEQAKLLDFIRATGKPDGLRIYMDIGTNETSNANDENFQQLYVQSNQALYETLREVGFTEDDVTFVVDEGAEHNELAWARRFPDALRFMFKLT